MFLVPSDPKPCLHLHSYGPTQICRLMAKAVQNRKLGTVTEALTPTSRLVLYAIHLTVCSGCSVSNMTPKDCIISVGRNCIMDGQLTAKVYLWTHPGQSCARCAAAARKMSL